MTIFLSAAKIGVYFGLVSIFFCFSLGISSAQIITTPKQVTSNTDIFRVVIALFGVDKKTGDVLSFVKVNNVTNARYFNAAKEDSADKDGIVMTSISFPNETVSVGANFTACEVVLKDLTMSCKSGLNTPGITETIQFVLPTYKH